MPLTAVHHHAWNLTPADARALQLTLAARAELVDRFDAIALVAGIDIGFEQAGAVTRAAVAVLRLADLQPVECQVVRRPTAFSYVPGLLSFREIPAAVEALARLGTTPDLFAVRRPGLRPSAPFWPGLPSRLAAGRALHRGRQIAPDRTLRRARARARRLGAAARSRPGDRRRAALARVKPVFVSSGHRVGLASATRLALACTDRYRLPEPARHAHRLASAR